MVVYPGANVRPKLSVEESDIFKINDNDDDDDDDDDDYDDDDDADAIKLARPVSVCSVSSFTYPSPYLPCMTSSRS